MELISEKAPNKHELRTMETRDLLLQSAEKIFIRDGYEGADLGEIAALAGRTKGAIYAHFKSKEDIFLALIEEHAARARAQMEELLADSTSIEENRGALRKFYLELSEDQSWALLFLEFKLFSIRHPEAKKRLQSFFRRVIPPSSEKKYAQILGPAGKGRDAVSRLLAVQMLQPIISALVLEMRFDQTLEKDDVLKKVGGRIFDVLI